MIKNLLITILFLFSAQLFGQKLNKIISDPKINKKVLIGECNRNGLKSEIFKEYYKEEYKNYNPEKNIIKKLKKNNEEFRIKIIMASWCGDSKEQVPRFYKILDKIKFGEDKIELIAVDRTISAGGIDISKLDIERVPTFIFYRNGKEIGRIIETPRETLEKDMLKIVVNKHY